MIVPAPLPSINLGQLETELNAAGLVTNGIGFHPNQDGSGTLHAYDVKGNGIDFDSSQFRLIQRVLSQHRAMRPLTDEELNIAYAKANNAQDTQGMQDLVAMASGLIPRTLVPMEKRNG